MVTTLYIIFGLILLGIMISVVWRLVSNRQELPCPSWLGWMVEFDNPYRNNWRLEGTGCRTIQASKVSVARSRTRPSGHSISWISK